jgi:hypothetical protein
VASVLRALFGQTRSAARAVHIYVSEPSVIVAAMHMNLAGIYYEQPEPIVVEGMPSAGQLGTAFREAFDRFSVKDADLRDSKRSEWPSFRASRLRSVKEFESQYRPMRCYGVNSSNALVRATIEHPSRPEIELATSFNPCLPSETLGESLLRLLEAANAT